jgi:hypothetical protein
MRRAHRATGRGATGRIPGQGEWARGQSHGQSKLEDHEVHGIRKLAGTLLPGVIARRYGISRITVLDIIARRTWKHLESGS